MTKSLITIQKAMITICNPKENEDERKKDLRKLTEKIEKK